MGAKLQLFEHIKNYHCHSDRTNLQKEKKDVILQPISNACDMKKQTNNNRELAQILFLQGGLQKKDIAEKLGVSQQTITNWAKADNWDALKKNLLTGKKRILSQLYDELSEFNRMIEDRQGYKVATSKEADARRKLIKDIKDLESKYSIAQTTQIAMDFCDFLKPLDYDLAQTVTEYFSAFIQEQVEKQKWQE